MLTGGMVRHFLNRVDAGEEPMKVAWALPAAAVALIAAIVWTAPRTATVAGGVSEGEALKIVSTHCVMCHQAKPTHEAFKGGEPPKGVVLNTVDGLKKNAQQVMLQAVQGRAMPLGNETGMKDEERAKLGAYLAQAGKS